MANKEQFEGMQLVCRTIIRDEVLEIIDAVKDNFGVKYSAISNGGQQRIPLGAVIRPISEYEKFLRRLHRVPEPDTSPVPKGYKQIDLYVLKLMKIWGHFGMK